MNDTVIDSQIAHLPVSLDDCNMHFANALWKGKCLNIDAVIRKALPWVQADTWDL